MVITKFLIIAFGFIAIIFEIISLTFLFLDSAPAKKIRKLIYLSVLVMTCLMLAGLLSLLL